MCFFGVGYTCLRGILCFQKKEFMPERDGRRLVTGPNGAYKARERLLDFIESRSNIVYQTG
jgi:hypothetical protein